MEYSEADYEDACPPMKAYTSKVTTIFLILCFNVSDIDAFLPLNYLIKTRAILFKTASKYGVTDGQDEEVRIRRDRIVRPRLFQLIKKINGFDTFASESNFHSSSSRRRHSKNQHHNSHQ